MLRFAATLVALVFTVLSPSATRSAGKYENFTTSIYARVYEVRQMADPAWLEPRWNEISRQLKVDKIYLETHRDMIVAEKETILKLKKFFQDRGVRVAGGITITVNERNRFETFCYSNPEHRKKLKEIVEFTAGLFDEIILDDFFFTNCKCEYCIRAKGPKSWTRFRLDLLDEAARNLIIKPAKAINPKVKMVVKYPNWYEHFQGLGFNLETEPKLFDGIYTGTETRDRTGDQHLQEYLGYSIFRYFENIKPGGNGGGWVDTYGGRYMDRYAEQLWLTLFAKAPEITLFDFGQMLRQMSPAERAPWQGQQTSFDFDAMMAPVIRPDGTSVKPTTYARAAGYTLEQVDLFVGKLGKPIGLKSYKPYHSTGEDFLHTYLGMIGVPVDLMPEFPSEAQTVLLTECAAHDAAIVEKIKKQLMDGKSVVITSGLLRALQGKGIEDIAEIRYTDRKAILKGFRGQPSFPPDVHILIPQLQYLTNDAWELVSGMAQNDLGYPLLIQAGYGKGSLYVMTIPENFSDLYSFPAPVLTQLRNTLLRDLFVRIESPGDVSLFVYDNDTFIVESFRPESLDVRISLDPKFTGIRELTTGEDLVGQSGGGAPAGFGGFSQSGGRRTLVQIKIKPHSYRAFSARQ
ncbi:MAG TPA: hypothetical protein VMG30_08140 [Acidobacteriota bacterium]|nr:hypothetical protein [Acidobacteriota bacterium]